MKKLMFLAVLLSLVFTSCNTMINIPTSAVWESYSDKDEEYTKIPLRRVGFGNNAYRAKFIKDGEFEVITKDDYWLIQSENIRN